MKLGRLISSIEYAHTQIQKYAIQQVNYALTVRNWIIGAYLFHYEQSGEDRAIYGDRLYKTIEAGVKEKGIKGLSFTNLHLYKQFYLTYPQIVQTPSEQSNPALSKIIQTVSEQFGTDILRETDTRGNVSYLPINSLSYSSGQLLSCLSFSHFIELMKAETVIKRSFYEVQSIKNNWSVRELKRAINTLLFERTGMSADKEKVISKIKDEIKVLPEDFIRNPYILDFLGLDSKNEFSETDLEENDALVKYATGGLSHKVFASKYLVQFPAETDLKQLIEHETKIFEEKKQNL